MLLHFSSSPFTTNSTIVVEPSLRLDENMFAKLASNLQGVLGTQFNGFVKKFVEYENTIMNLSYSFGGSRAFAEEFKKSMAGASLDVKSMGGTFDDIDDILKGATEGMGVATTLTSQGISQLYASISMAEGGVKVTKEAAKSLIENFTKAGTSVYNIGEKVTSIFNVAKEAGVNAKQVFDEVEKNLIKVNLFNFKNGVEGMAKMSALAQTLRISMDDALQFAEQLYDPEKAVEVASVFQRFGMGGLSNIYELQDLARNDPGKLMEIMAKEFSKLTITDPETGERRMSGYGMELVRELSKQIPGLKQETIINQALAMGDLQEKMKNIKLPDWATDPSMKEFIIKQAQKTEKGQYVISLDGKERDVSTLTEDESLRYKQMVQTQQQGNANVVEASQAGAHEFVKLNNTIIALHNFYPTLLASNTSLSNAMYNGAKLIREGIEGKTMPKTFGVNVVQGKKGKTFDASAAMTNINQGAETMAVDIFTALPNVFKNAMLNIEKLGPNAKASDIAYILGGIAGDMTNALKTGFLQAFPQMQDPVGVMQGLIDPFLDASAQITNNPAALVQTPYLTQPQIPLTVGSNVTAQAATQSLNLTQTNPWKLDLNINSTPGGLKLQDLLEPQILSQLTSAITSEQARQQVGRILEIK